MGSVLKQCVKGGPLIVPNGSSVLKGDLNVEQCVKVGPLIVPNGSSVLKGDL